MPDTYTSDAQSPFHGPTVSPLETVEAFPPGALTLLPETYSRFLNETNWSDEQRREYTAIVWNICVMFVDLAFRTQNIDIQSGDETLEVDSPAMLGSNVSSTSINVTNADRAEARSGVRMES